MKCYWEHLKEYIGILMGTVLDYIESKKIPPPNPHPQSRRKKLSLLNFLIGCMKFFVPKWFITISNLAIINWAYFL
jgi:hypothetical protein